MAQSHKHDYWFSISNTPPPMDGTPIIGCCLPDNGINWDIVKELHVMPTTLSYRPYYLNIRGGEMAWRRYDGKIAYPTHWKPVPDAPKKTKRS